MPKWVNYVYIVAPVNGTTAHTVDPSSATGVLAGSAFSPTAGRRLVVVSEAAVTSTTPAGWTLPTNGDAVQNTGLYVWHRVAAGADTISTTHNASNHQAGFAVFEFPASSTFVGAAKAVGASTTAANPTLSGLTGTNQVFGAAAWDDSVSAGTTGSATWGSPNVGLLDNNTDYDVGNGNDGFWLGICYQEDYVSATYAPVPTITAPAAGTSERLTFAVNVPSAGTTGIVSPVQTFGPSYAASRAASF